MTDIQESPQSGRAALRADEETRLQRLDDLAVLLDESIRIPGIGYRIGYDALVGLIPGIGDAAGLLVSTYIVYQASRFDIPRSTLLRMIANVAIEAIVGTVPLAGDLFDATYKANLRNLRLLRRRLGESDDPGRSDRLFFFVLAAVPIGVALLMLAAVGAFLIALL